MIDLRKPRPLPPPPELIRLDRIDGLDVAPPPRAYLIGISVAAKVLRPLRYKLGIVRRVKRPLAELLEC